VFRQKQNSGFEMYVGFAQLMTCGSLQRSKPRKAGLAAARRATAS
jgi:hypothetical protein